MRSADGTDLRRNSKRTGRGVYYLKVLKSKIRGVGYFRQREDTLMQIWDFRFRIREGEWETESFQINFDGLTMDQPHASKSPLGVRLAGSSNMSRITFAQ